MIMTNSTVPAQGRTRPQIKLTSLKRAYSPLSRPKQSFAQPQRQCNSTITSIYNVSRYNEVNQIFDQLMNKISRKDEEKRKEYNKTFFKQTSILDRQVSTYQTFLKENDIKDIRFGDYDINVNWNDEHDIKYVHNNENEEDNLIG
ncbi:hypothetical protein SS50377_21755 [Spironucleus salmonicida]|uniref:Uncharacterized protein n=1 Tax=Spironucleus salmonicida TaxID=348837 RepID=V6LX49_9EUKA|nr:hypothetical protein SS50377_21755 [Spironucleus salmonicida]|eukprot:EST45394.1 Hypothetical protein SS50377_14669 [Spironucleus salmonicida]